jgi:excisionase family DNA binding protein
MTKPLPPIPPVGLLTPKELADLLKLSLPTVRRYVNNGTIPFIQIGNRVRFEPEAVLQSLRKAKPKP